jgi:hypothetical protein
MAVGAVMDAYFLEGADYRPADRWISELERLLNQHSDPLPADLGARVLSACQCAILRQPEHALLATWIDRAWGLLRVSLEGSAPHAKVIDPDELFRHDRSSRNGIQLSYGFLNRWRCAERSKPVRVQSFPYKKQRTSCVGDSAVVPG